MKRALLGSAAALAIAIGFVGFAGSAFADVTVTVNVDKTKDITIVETIRINKRVGIEVTVINSARKAAEADSFINQTNFNNKACENCAEKIDEILQSVNGNSGIVTVNQAAGNNNNQGSVLTAAIDDFGDGNGNGGTNGTGFFGYAEAQAAVDQRNGWVLNEEPGAHDPAPNEVDSVAILFRESDIVDSINQNLGAVMVNQATGHMNNQANNIVLAVSFDGLGGVALTEAELGQETSNNISSESDVIKSVFMVDSVNGNKGVILVNQAGGNMTNQANVLSLGAAAVSGSLVSKL